MSILRRMFQRKASEALTLVSLDKMGRAQPTPRNYESFANEGFKKNGVAYRAVSSTAKAVGGIKWLLYKKKKGSSEITELEDHPLLTLLKRPNPMQGQSSFFESMTAYFMISGNSYIEAVGPKPGAVPMELWVLRPDMMKVVPGPGGMPGSYVFTAGQDNKKVFAVDVVKRKSPILHLKSFNPTNHWYGMSPIEAAVLSVDQHNAAGEWNHNLLNNEGKPSGVFTVKVDEKNISGRLDDVQYERLKKELQDSYAGGKNAGRMMLLEGGLDWKGMSFNPVDMDWIEGKNTSARDIALVLGMPPMLLGIPGDNTYSNQKEARQAFYMETVLPTADFIRDELNNWLTPAFGDDLCLDYDKDDIEALAPTREATWTRISNAKFLTINEQREAVGYEPIEGGDVVPGVAASSEGDDGDDSDDAGDEEEPADPKKPVEDEEEETELEEDEGKSEFKLVNLLTTNEKQRSARAQLRRREALEKQFEQDLAEDLLAQADDIAKAAVGTSRSLTEFAVLQAIDRHEAILKSTIKKHVKRSVQEFGNQLLNVGKAWAPDMEQKSTIKFQQFVEAFIEARAAKAVSLIQGTTTKKARSIIRDTVLEGVTEGEGQERIAAELRERLDGLSKSRSHTIARTEVAVASTQGSLGAAKALNVPGLKKEWVSVQDNRTRDENGEANHEVMNGVKVDIHEKFTVPPDASMDGPGDPSAEPSQVVNCRCVLVYSR